MSAVVAERPRLFRDTHRPPDRDDAPRRRPDTSGGDRPTTLEQRLERVWEGLRSARSTNACPVCGSDGQWRRVASTHPSDPPAGGFRCGSCGSVLH